ncbi:pyridoxamine 5'-phosphate oxidase [Deinococcus yavapaiensis]|uniref:Pyridoxine/pyridoxamine 5'-phosphate oxidase n=1 Tax=Deinococcus yavapaiensis KR-236 TaxID=694435 RepID=A0A318SC84_9DEIO|nr:pyridoxamine 5'-phosphate oxidase [Deinococcus yavapaiensis]PYE56203.1 pyridoxamine 5'-phosphate oxidase [Deinococcus yavapaiensis KR-236]
MTDLTKLRLTYAKGELRRADLHGDPVEQFRAWLDEALASDLPEPYATTVATASASGRPSARTVLLRGFDARGFVFYTNYTSRKGQDLAENPQAALLFYWPGLERQVRVEGRVEQVSSEESDAYWRSRPRDSQIGAHASGRQSHPIADRDALEARFEELRTQFVQDVSRPGHWGGYRVVPDTFEFWQGRPSRVHDRFQYTRQAEGWKIERLTP